MKTFSISMAVALATLTAGADLKAQVPGQMQPLWNVQQSYGRQTRSYSPYAPAPWHHHSSTAAEGYMRGMATLYYGRGAYNVMNAQARIMHAEAYSLELANREQKAATFFAMRAANQEARAAERGPRPTQADMARVAQMGQPHQLSDDQLDDGTGTVTWPTLLQANEFAGFRGELEALLAQRAAFGQLDLNQKKQVGQTAASMLKNLQKYVRQVHPMDYSAAQQFIKSIAHEARQPVG